MHTLFKCAALVPLLLVTPTAGQDILAPLQDMVDQLTRPEPPPRTPSRVTPPEPAAVAPVPRPRPPDMPEVTPPSPPSAEPVEEAEPEPEPVVEEEEVEEAEPVVAEPEPEPSRTYQVACPAVIMGLVEAEMAAPLSEGACGEQSPLTVTGVMSRGRLVPLSSPVTTNCQMATALPDWVATVDGYAQSMLESPLARLDTGTSYMCRNRNNGATGFTSEHGFANALDIVGFTLEDGRSIAVADDWAGATAPEGRLLRLAHDAACASFMTVLGPEANAEHEDHFHLDQGCHGQSCRARICE